ncbi:hypothetical protein PROFUN_05124 [Planoprotostelium fungivorum]|uniref:Lactoylglutathione lyase n=1 Tax=Planoprotostelium fungivorum TaxID=1890364 RepID=A0A2P6NRQ6_9EUKA|nr:hypothetical protein PROFUN_05124 [Planoprotostelium fungivorum]
MEIMSVWLLIIWPKRQGLQMRRKPTDDMTTDPSKYILNHSMLRVKDIEASLKFYRDLLGMSVIHKIDFQEAKFSLYFLAYETEENKGKHWTSRPGILELTHNWGTEKDEAFHYHNGNTEPKGFGHVCISVDNIQPACARLEAAGVKFQKKLSDGRQKDIAFALDPDNYWVELISQKTKFPEGSLKADETHSTNYRFNHTMIRVKDPKASLQFYQDVFGMKLARTSVHESAKFTLYFLAYLDGEAPTAEGGVNPISDRESVLELTHNWGTESDPEFKGYVNGNSEPHRGFGHICFSVDHLEAACKRLEDKNVKWQKKLTDGRMKTVAFVLDPDNYWVEIIAQDSHHG